MNPQQYLWTWEIAHNAGWARTFTAGPDLLWIVSPAGDGQMFYPVMIDTSGTEPTYHTSSYAFIGNPNVAACNNRGHLSVFESFGTNRKGWTFANVGNEIITTEWTLDDSVIPADFGTHTGPWRHTDVVTLSPDGRELFVGGIDIVDGERVGQMWSVDTSTGAVNWVVDGYALPAGTGMLGPCIGSPANGMAIACYDHPIGNNGDATFTFYLLHQGGVASTVSDTPVWSTNNDQIGYSYKLNRREYWCETNDGRLTYVIAYEGYSGMIAEIRSLQVSGTTLSWAAPNPWRLDMGTSWKNGGDDPWWDLPRDAWDGQIALLYNVYNDPKWALWYDVPTGESAVSEGAMTTALDYLQVHATGKSTTIRANLTAGPAFVSLDKWGPGAVPVLMGIYPLRMSARDDGYGWTAPHARFQQNRNASSSATTGQRIFGTGKNASDPPDPV